MRKKGLWLGLLMAVIAGNACRPQQEANIIKIGEYASLTGKEAAFGQSSHNGTQLAIDEANAAGGVLGKQLRLLTEDTQSKSGESATVVRKLINRDGVVAVLGEVASSRSLEGATVCQQSGIPMISPSSTNPQVTQTGSYIFRVCFTDPFQGKLIAEFARNHLKVARVGILKDVGSAYSKGLADFFKQPFVAAGGQVVAENNYNGGDKDFKAQLTAIRAANPDAIFIPGYYTEAGLIARQARQLGIQVPLFGGDGWEAPELLEIGGEALENTFYSTHYFPGDANPLVKDFVTKYQERYKKVPDSMAALGYDSARVLVDALRRAGNTDPALLRKAIAETRDFAGVTGLTTLDDSRNAHKSAVIITIRNGKFELLQTIKAQP